MGHKIEVYVGGITYVLACDGKALDKHKSLIVIFLNLSGVVEGHNIMVSLAPGIVAPSVSIYIDGVRQHNFN